jgi:hypothetical protein
MAHHRPFAVLFAFLIVASLSACSIPGNAPAPAAPSASPSEPAAVTLGQCSNPLLPVIKGAKWTYAISGITTGTFTHSITDVRPDGFTDQDVFDAGVTRTGEWKCDNGNLTALSPAEGLNAVVQTQGMTANFQTTSSTGITLPAAVKSGDSWSQTFTIEGTQKIAGSDVKGKGDMSYSCTAAGTETVSVPAGSFDAIRVGCQIDGTITINTAGIEGPTALTSTATIWYASDVGMVKTENEITDMGHSTIELTSYTVP